MTYRLGVDVGGTFTDVLLIDQNFGSTYRAKTASTPEDQSLGVLRGFEKVRSNAAISLADIEQVLHGTTVATNDSFEGTGARVGLVTTRGFASHCRSPGRSCPVGWPGGSSGPSPSPSPPSKIRSRPKSASTPRGRW